MAEGIQGSAVVLICVTEEYMDKVGRDGNDNRKLEFEYAYRKRTAQFMLPVVMEESMTNPSEWNGSLGLALGSHLYCKLVDDEQTAFDDAVQKIAAAVRKMLDRAPNFYGDI